MSVIRFKDLKTAPNLQKTFNSLNQHLYGKLKYTDTDTRTRSKEVINLLLCKLVDETNKKPDDLMEFCIKNGESERALFDRINNFFDINVKKKYPNVIDDTDQINLNLDLIYLVVNELQEISLLSSSKDIFRDAFEVFVSRILKEQGGQFFTPANVIKFMINYLNPELGSLILDPACGHGGFLLQIKDLFWSKIDETYKDDEITAEKKKREIISNLYGIDKDLYLTKLCKLYLEILSNGKANIYCEDSLDVEKYRNDAKEIISNSKFDYILTNPPFGMKIPVDDRNLLKHYDLGHSWKNQGYNSWRRLYRLMKKQPPQILFIERCIQLLKDGGKMGIILPEGIFGNPTNRYIWQYLEQSGRILGIISLDPNTFQPYTCNKVSVLFFQKLGSIPENYEIDFAIVDNVGHDKDGKVLYKLNKDGTPILDPKKAPIVNDDLIELHSYIQSAEAFNYQKEQKIFKITKDQIKNKVYIPSYYIGVEKTLKKMAEDNSIELLSIRDLIKRKIIFAKKNGHLPRGDEIGSQLYGLGELPFIRTSDFVNWEINLDSHKKTSEEVYDLFKDKQKIEVGDILLVKDGGPNLIGNTAFVTELDTKIIIQSHIFQIKVLENNHAIDPYMILYLLNLEIVQQQIQAVTFVQGTIASIGNRIMEIFLPIPASIDMRKELSNSVKELIEKKTEIRKKIKELSLDYFIS